MKARDFTVTAERIINLGNYRSLHLGGSFTIDLSPGDDAIECFESAQRQYLKSLNDTADRIEREATK